MVVSLRRFKLAVQSDYIKDVTTLATGTGFGHAVPIVAAPLLTRLYSPGDYGFMTLYMTLTSLITVAASGMYSHAILLAENDEQAINSLALCWLISAGLSLLVLAVVVGLHHTLNNLAIIRDMGGWLYLMPVSVLLGGGYQNLYSWSNRHKQYGELARCRVAQAVSGTGSQLLLGFMQFGAGGLIVGVVAGQFVSVILMAWRSISHVQRNLSKLSWGMMGQRMIKHKRFPLYVLPTEFLNVAINRIPVFFLNTFAALGSVGFYGFALRILGLPTSFMSSSIAEVFRERASREYRRRGTCHEIYVKTLISLALTGLLPFTCLFVAAPNLFAVVFGEPWREAGEYVRWLSVMYYFGFVSSPLSYVYFITHRQVEDLLLHVYMLVSTIISMYLGFWIFEEVIYVVALFSINYALIYIVYLVRSYSLAKGAAQ